MPPDQPPSPGQESGAIPPPPDWWAVNPAAAGGGGGSAAGGETTEELLASHQQNWRRDSLVQELAACRQELAEMQALLDDLPRIFESKFGSRLQPLLEQKQRLLEGNHGLREELSRLQPGGPAIAGQLLPVQEPGAAPPPGRRESWTRSLRHAFGLTERRSE